MIVTAIKVVYNATHSHKGESRMKCFCHNDFDGRAAGAIVKLKLAECKIIEIDYRDEFPLETIKKDETVFILDYSIKPEVMEKLLDITDGVIWIDHHQTSIDMYKDFKRPIKGIREVGTAGCLLTWKWFNSDKRPPKGILYIHDWDTWKKEYGAITDHFNAGLYLYDTSPTNIEFWRQLISEDSGLLNDILDKGNIILKYRKQWYNDFYNLWGYEAIFEGHVCAVMNLARIGSDAFGDKIEAYKICICYAHDGEQFTVSLYSGQGVDVKELAEKYGGGGHKEASGFQCDTLPFTKIKND